MFIAAVLVRIYWAFAGNRYVSWRALLPITKAQRRDLRETMPLLRVPAARSPPRLNGHNPLAGLAYVVLYLGFIVTILTGLGLFAWVIRTPPGRPCSGGPTTVMSVPTLRLVHFLLMFFYIAFAVHHVYSAGLFDIEERNGELSSIVTGYKANMLEGEPPRGRPPADESDDGRDTAVIGLGNVVLSDDGLGVHAVRRLRERYAARRRRRADRRRDGRAAAAAASWPTRAA